MEECVSLVPRRLAAGKRNVKKVPFVELFSGRVQGVVSSGSDIKRVYVSFIEAQSGNFYCSTNNNRPCGGLYGSPCKHIHSLVDEAILEFGPEAVARYLAVQGEPASFKTSGDLIRALSGSQQKESPGVVFSRFLHYLRFCELSAKPGMVLEMGWFVS